MKRQRRKLRAPVSLPAVSQYASRAVWEKACWEQLLYSPAQLTHILTPYERRNLILRAVAEHRLLQGVSYGDIGKELWLSPQTISVIKKGMRERGYRSYAERGKTERKKKVFHSSVSGPRRKIRIGTPKRTKYGIRYI